MEDLTLAVPGLWADHHVLAVLDLLRKEPGVTAVAASALDGSVHLTFDPRQTDASRLRSRLEDGGYAAGEPASADESRPDAPGWSGGLRVTTTNPADLSMSGDHRKY